MAKPSFPAMHLKPRDDGSGETWRVIARTGTSLPLTKRAIRFAAHRDDGRTSRPWKVEAQANGEIYIRGRDCFGESHVSLHASGLAHIKPTAKHRSSDVLNWSWIHGKTALHILFGPWSCPITDHADRKIWDRNDLLLPLDDDWGVAVSFVRLPSGIPLNPPKRFAAVNLAQMRMSSVNETLWVVAYQIHPPWAEAELDRSLRERADLFPKHLNSIATGTIIDVQLHGIMDRDAGFVIPFQVEVSQSD